ncbi:uncharacterized protein LOC107269022 [Cephus cinctus]|uniref:Uncharacterized protein LOC107269022 n=1 Tax=Cephus cinctus TaxID=211228 RepID=A0AAJ7RKA0_CEPCN|nr:uncharacterized protein LOC107269022 [Cephus cinctus]XP_024942018.1 uncharacterized protein LOC107269022 [Cephus cinctus]
MENELIDTLQFHSGNDMATSIVSKEPSSSPNDSDVEDDNYYEDIDFDQDSDIEKQVHPPPLLTPSQLCALANSVQPESQALPSVSNDSDTVEMLEENNNDPNNNLDAVQMLGQNQNLSIKLDILSIEESHSRTESASLDSPKPGCSKDSYYEESRSESQCHSPSQTPIPSCSFTSSHSSSTSVSSCRIISSCSTTFPTSSLSNGHTSLDTTCILPNQNFSHEVHLPVHRLTESKDCYNDTDEDEDNDDIQNNKVEVKSNPTLPVKRRYRDDVCTTKPKKLSLISREKSHESLVGG